MSTQVGPLIRTAILVADLDCSIAFYGNVLGLPDTYFHGHIDDPAMARLLGIADLKSSRFAILKAEGPAIGMIGLFEIPDAEKYCLETDSPVGRTCLVFNHPNLNDLNARLELGGHTIVCPPTKIRITDDLESLEMTFRDPDGVMINCIERDP